MEEGRLEWAGEMEIDSNRETKSQTEWEGFESEAVDYSGRVQDSEADIKTGFTHERRSVIVFILCEIKVHLQCYCNN